MYALLARVSQPLRADIRLHEKGMRVLDRLLPRSIDNRYRGSQVALWILVPITLLTFYRGGVHLLLPDSGAQSIATIPLDSYSAEGAKTVVSFIAQWGWLQLLMACLYVIVLFRYRALIPLIYLLLFVEYVGRNVIGLALSLRWKEEGAESPDRVRDLQEEP
jgi:hypothetical protein